MSFGLSGCSTPAATTATSTARISFATAGTGTPAVVFQSGLGDGKSVWSPVVVALGGEVRTFAYDRPGYGDSPATLAPRDPTTIARELHTALHEAGVPPPYVLVGHSLGGLYQYVFATLYPQEVAGIVLLDPTHPEHLASMERETPALAVLLRTLRLTVFGRTARAEFDAQVHDLPANNAVLPLKVPARLLTRTQHAATESEAFVAMTHRLERDWSRRLGGCAVDRAENAGHYLQKDRPDLVVKAIKELTVQSGATHMATARE